MLNIVIDKPDNLGEKEECHHINLLTVVMSYFRYEIFKAEDNYAGERLVPVGKCCNGDLLLFVPEPGKVYHDSGKCGDTRQRH